MAAFHPEASYYIPAHLERAGPFNPDGNNGFNVEHLRNFNNAAPRIAFGFESMPGHQAQEDRGGYGTGAAGGGTFGGTGAYAGQTLAQRRAAARGARRPPRIRRRPRRGRPASR